MADQTAAERVRRYRISQRTKRGIKRVEVQAPAAASVDVKKLGQKLVAAFKRAKEASPQVRLVLSTINAPRAKPIDSGTLVHCLLAIEPNPKWRPHIEALFDEVSPEAIHDLVLAKVVDFEDLYRASRTWRVTHGQTVDWIKEMADLRLASAAASEET